MAEAVIFEAVRTPFGRRDSALREVRPDKLRAHALEGLAERAGLDAEKIEDVVCGTVTQAGEQGANAGRLAKMLAGLEAMGGQLGLQVMCIGHGMSTATIIERL